MSHIFDTLRRLDDERGDRDSRVPSEAVDLLGLAEARLAAQEARLAAQSEAGRREPAGEYPRQAPSSEARLRIVGLPLMVGGWSPSNVPGPVSESPVPATPFHPTPASVSPAYVSTNFSALAEEPQLKVHQEVTATIIPEKSVAVPAEESTPKVHQEVPASIQKEQSVAHSPATPLIKLPSGVQRVVSTLRTLLPYVERILPLFEGNFSTALTNLLAPHQPAPPAPELPPVDLAPLKGSLAVLNTQYLELREEAIEREASMRRIEDQLEMVRLSTDRNTLQQQELIEDLKSLGSKVGFVTMVALGLLAISVIVNTVLYLHMVKVLR
jgi:hypothetical protein